jgi:Rrf2 family iron-sulfur cluster assembly transcriptional regulator
MKISTKGHYAVQAMVDLATRKSDQPVPLSAIAKRQNISLNYLEQLFLKLRKMNMVKSARGPGGGYILARDPSQISIGEIFDAVNENIVLTECIDDNSFCSKTHNCLTQILWLKISESLKKTLFSITLGEVIEETGKFEELRTDSGLVYDMR